MTVLSPFLLALYIVVYRSQHANTPVVSFPDGTGLTGLITDDDTPTTGNRLAALWFGMTRTTSNLKGQR